MSGNTIGTVQYGSLIIAAGQTATIYPARCGQPYKYLSIVVRPVTSSSPYKVTVYHDDEVAEEHDYTDPASKVISEMGYSGFVFPPSYGMGSIPVFSQAGMSPLGLTVKVVVTNHASETKTFEVYCSYEVFEVSQYASIHAE